MSTLFAAALARKNLGRPPVWFMRQAGRYHSHYQKLKQRHTFMELCKQPELACEVTMGPIEDFGFDAAILFSDLLFPLEVMGMGLRYEPGPKLGWQLSSPADLAKLQGGIELARGLQFQAEALRAIRARLPAEKGLIGFVGGPLTLFAYAVEGSHAGELASTRAGLTDGRFSGFQEKLRDLLAENMALQARAGAEVVAMFDTCAGELDAETYRRYAVPAIREVLEGFRAKQPGTPVIYYSRGTGPAHWRALEGLPIDCLGIDWKHELTGALREWTPKYAVQGNIDPEWLHLEPAELERRLREVFASVRGLPDSIRAAWVCGLGHGVLQFTPEDNVRLFLKLQREYFG